MRTAYRRARDAEIVNRAAIARLYNRNPADIIVVNHDTALAIKVSFPRPQSSGSKHDSDVYGGQQYAPRHSRKKELERRYRTDRLRS